MIRALALPLACAAALATLGAAAGDAPIRLAIKSGTPQSAHAWAAPNARTYEATFGSPLVVTVSPARSAAKIRFRCITAGCTFPAQEQPGDRVDPSAFDVTSDNGSASIALTIRAYTPQTVTVLAQPAGGEAHSAGVRFDLTLR